ncbi:MAG: 50S ribosomal protein L38e [Thermoprotei archaeon]|nr:MAG: 50S ribosomal protein L38e [Thermoprotei archaeon]RLE56743.1 MAG: 50S ribosomal protein L38e [Thermoprotei archaeon]
MPKEIFNIDEFIRLAQYARECRVKRLEDEGIVKLKLRLKRYLYTIKLDPKTAEEILKKIKDKCPVREV